METQAVTLRPLQASAADSVEQVILRRGSTRRFLQEAIAFEQLSTILMADIHQVTSRLGPRGYRAALLEGGVAGGRLYLAAYSLKLGATGTTFYDDEVTKFFSPHAAGKSPTLAIGIGRDPRFLRSPN